MFFDQYLPAQFQELHQLFDYVKTDKTNNKHSLESTSTLALPQSVLSPNVSNLYLRIVAD